MRALMWFREDLRIEDNAALSKACSLSEQVIAIYIVSENAWRDHDVAPCRIDFIYKNLHELKTSLEKLNIPLIFSVVENDAEIPQLLYRVMDEYQIESLFFNRQYPVDEVKRDLAVEDYLTKHNKKVKHYTDEVILEPGELIALNGNYYKVFTPFKNAFLKRVEKTNLFSAYPKPKAQPKIKITSADIPITQVNNRWEAGEKSAKKHLEFFIKNKMSVYAKQRDFPGLEATSQLSPYLASGIISIRACFREAKEPSWMNELIWREFYKHIVYLFPRVARHQPFKPQKIKWDNNPEKFQAWCEGKTGYPLIDAAMRQLKDLGWMHNRLRMLVAMFLTKDLLIDWRLGEKYFMQNLIDGDLAANNGGWQWVAGCGTDAAPYFRIFNPITQSEKFDPKGEFIKKYCPELKSLSDKALHFPSSVERKQCNYPEPIVDHDKARVRYLSFYQ